MGSKRKYNKGTVRSEHKPAILFGMIDTVTKKCIVYLVDNCKGVTLWPLIEKHCKKGSMIYSD